MLLKDWRRGGLPVPGVQPENQGLARNVFHRDKHADLA